MFNQKIKYTLLSLTVLSLSACNQKTIVLQPGESTHQQPTKRVYRVDRPIVQEEVLIKKNPNLGSVVTTPVVTTPVVTTPVVTTPPVVTPTERRVAVPQNNPSLGTVITSGGTENSSTEGLVNSVKIERIPFPEDEYSQIKKIGRSTVKGSIFLENNQNNEKIMGQKVKLYLNPVTSYSKQWYEESYLAGNKMSKSDPRLFNYLKFTVSDENGRFNFFGVPQGNYYLVGTVTCSNECGFSENQTVRLVEEVSVGGGTTNVTLTKNVP